MSKRLILVPDGWPIPLRECRPGLFTYPPSTGGSVGLLTEYGEPGKVEAYCGDSGETWWGGAPGDKERGDMVVQPVRAEWEEEG